MRYRGHERNSRRGSSWSRLHSLCIESREARRVLDSKLVELGEDLFEARQNSTTPVPFEGFNGKDSFVYIFDDLYSSRVLIDVPSPLNDDRVDLLQNAVPTQIDFLGNDSEDAEPPSPFVVIEEPIADDPTAAEQVVRRMTAIVKDDLVGQRHFVRQHGLVTCATAWSWCEVSTRFRPPQLQAVLRCVRGPALLAVVDAFSSVVDRWQPQAVAHFRWC